MFFSVCFIMVTPPKQGSKQAFSLLQKERIVKFQSVEHEKKGIQTLHITRTPFSYIGNDRYRVTKKQCVVLTEAGVKHRIVKYLD